jgi:hypothetical protein
MENTINQHIDKIQKSIDWVNSNLIGEKKKGSYSRLVDCRRKLNKIKFAIDENPSAAMYGESQMGKSYLVSSLLSTHENPFNVVDQFGRKYNYITEINPIGNEKESTSLVTRFSLNYTWINDEYPVKVKLLSIVDIILLLCDTYYNDVKAHNFIIADELEKEIDILEIIKSETGILQEIICEDDILDIRDYFKTHFKSKAPYLESSTFFEKISLVIHRFVSSEWVQIFSLLWNKNKYITDIFSKLINKYEEIDFVKEVYVPYNSVLREFGTLLDVARLNEISINTVNIESNFKPDTVALYIDSNRNEVKKNVSKSYLCAMAAELIFKLPEELKASKPFLENTDLLDFPGARARLENYETDLNNELIPQMILRGKVAYLFNKYSDNYKINTLLFCHGKKQSAQRLMPEVLDRWISNFIGDSPDTRQKFINTSQIPPLFVIGTMFNLDLKFDQNDKKENSDALNNRWSQRFSIVLEKEIFGSETYDWLNNWSSDQKYFQNIYLLRDYYYSSEVQNQLFRGYNSDKQENEEIVPEQYPHFKNDLRDSFINYDFVKKHFKSPAESWDRAASMNEDGTGLIIENLTIAANNINAARNDKFIVQLNDISKQVVNELEKHFHSGNSDALLLKAKETAGGIQLKLDVAFGSDPYFFGKMMQRFIITEREIYNLYRDKLQSIELTEQINLEKYSAIRLSTPELSLTADFDKNLDLLRKKYEKPSNEVCKQDFEQEGIDLYELFYGNKNRIKNFSKTLAEALEKYWFEQCLKGKNYRNLIEIFSESAVSDIMAMLESLYHKLRLTDKIAESIRKYVDRYDNIEDVQEMIADISAEIINKFINSVGFSYYTDEDIKELNVANTNINLGLDLNHNYLSYNSFTSENVTNLFEILDKLPDLLNENPINQDILKNVPSFSNYKKWRDLLKFGFISVCDIPNYNIVANEKLGILKKECCEICYV